MVHALLALLAIVIGGYLSLGATVALILDEPAEFGEDVALARVVCSALALAGLMLFTGGTLGGAMLL